MGGNAKAKAAKAREKAQNDVLVVGNGKGKAAVVTGVSSESTKQKGKKILYELLPRIFTFFNNIYRSPL